jgi:hypothetical protein
MGIDHGLSGKDSDQSRLRREKRAKQARNLIKKLKTSDDDSGRKKSEIVFDEASRTAYLTGFRKRKQERRKYGLTMKILKEKRIIKDAKKARLSSKASSQEVFDDEVDEQQVETKVFDKSHDQQSVFNDEATVAMFGNAVSVVVNENPVILSGFADEDSNDEDDDEEANSENNDEDGQGSVASYQSRRSVKSSASKQSYQSRSSGKNPPRNQLTAFERAMKKVNETYGNGKSRKGKSNGKPNKISKEVRKKVESRKLLEKSLGRKLKSGRK